MSRSRASVDALSLNSSHSRSTDDGSSKKPPLWPAPQTADPAFVAGPTCPRTAPGLAGAPASGSRMRLLVDAAQSLVRNVSVGLGGGEGNVPQKLLDRPQVRAALQQVGGKAVAQGVRAGSGGRAGPCPVALQHSPDVPLRHRPPAPVE